MRRAAPLLTVSLVLGLAAGAFGDVPGAPRPSVHYTVRGDATLAHLTVDVCFDHAPPPQLGPGVASAGSAIEGAWHDRRPLPIERERIVLRGLEAGDCVRYRVDVESARRGSRFSGRYGVDFMASQGTWLWRDRREPPAGGATLRFELPPGLRAATPWPSDADGVQHLTDSAFRRPSFVAMGRFEPIVLEHRRVRATAVRLGDGWALDDDETRRWLTRAIDGVSTVQGRFPVDDLLVVLVPQRGRDLGFGMVRRGGGYSVAFQVGRRASADDIAAGWVSWHELSHLQLPALPQRDSWLYEGLATYYQEVLPARMGIQTPEQAWTALADGFARGERSRGGERTLEASARSMMQTYNFQRVYWAGTAYALESDVTLRRRGGSLDQALARAAPRWRGDLSLWSSQRVCAAWDRTLDAQVLRPLRDRYASSVGFPSPSALLERLGVRRQGRRVRLGPADLAPVRDAILARP